MAIENVEFDLSMTSPTTGRYLTANVYDVSFDDGSSLRGLSIGQLVMALCLKRAYEMETAIISLMDEMNSISSQLAAMTEIEKSMIDYEENGDNGGWTLNHWSIGSNNPVYGGWDYDDALHDLGVIPNDVNWVYRNGNTPSDPNRKYVQAKDLISDLEAKMDEKNSFSQQKMIELQSLTNKRDQSYDMISNILKSLNTVLVGNANNM